MVKRLQNKIAESRYALLVMSLYALAVWVTSGLVGKQWWVQLACFSLSTYLMVELNNGNALIRVYSRMVSCAFIMFSCMDCFLFGNMGGGIVQLCSVATYITLFRCYQDGQSAGWTYYAFLCVGLASMIFVQVLYFVPFLWLLMHLQLNALTWRTSVASLLGLVTPYWFLLCWIFFEGRYGMLADHFSQLAKFQSLGDYSQVTLTQCVVVGVVLITGAISTVHYLRTSFHDKIRVRQLYGFFIIMSFLTLVFMVLQPCHYDPLVRLMIVNVAPLLAHFFSLTHTRVTNVAFQVIVAVCLFVTVYNLWMLLSNS